LLYFLFLWIRRNRVKTVLGLFVLTAYYFCLPKTLFDAPFATVIESEDGHLLGAKIARDGQWRFPAQDSVPHKFKTCLLAFEDQHFYKHPGFNPVSLVQALRQNMASKRVVRGGSTLTQQVIRLSRKGPERSYSEKVVELILATRLEFRHSKEDILNLYASHAPFGGNVVGLEMASWRYFGVQPHQLSWAEAATLAVLPNAPALIYPGKNQERLLEKRNRLLKKLLDKGVLDEITYTLALDEPLPQKPYDLPQTAPHLVQRIAQKQEGERVVTSIRQPLQEQLNRITQLYHHQYQQNEIHNIALLVVEVKTRKIVGYVGNAPTDAQHKKDVDIIRAPRSTGSILKPLLFASMLDEGMILPNTLVADVPTQISGYVPQNFNATYDGAVPARRALSRSLNIPSVLMLQEYGVPRFHEQLQRYRLRNINKPSHHYGLSLILGGAESNLWDLCRTYAGLTSTLNHYTHERSQYRSKEWAELSYLKNHQPDFGKLSYEKNLMGAGAIYLTYEAMREVNRPEGDEAWQFYDSALPIAWKTGTSFGHRDAWAIGTTPDYVIGVWVGNATGEGRPGLTGVNYAAPIMFDAFRLLPKTGWFEQPLNAIEKTEVCALSGSLPHEGCPTEKQWIPLSGHQSPVCSYHKWIHLDREGFQVNSSCADMDDIQTQSWFVLPPVMAWYYKSKSIHYRDVPPYRMGCEPVQNNRMDFIYPKNETKIYLTKDFRSQVQPVIVKVAHSQPRMKLFWYLDRVYLGSTEKFHEMPITSSSGRFLITVMDQEGNEISRTVEIINEN
jgi:penicillin-binding protein 1C